MPTVFLSHSSRDKDAARRIAVDLSMSNIKVWFDEWQIAVGESISQNISRGLEDSAFVVVLLSAHSVESGWVQKEWMSRIGEEAQSKDVAILPVVVNDCTIPILLRDKRHADIRDNYDNALRELIASIRTLATSGEAVTAGLRLVTLGPRRPRRRNARDERRARRRGRAGVWLGPARRGRSGRQLASSSRAVPPRGSLPIGAEASLVERGDHANLEFESLGFEAQLGQGELH